MKSNEIFAECPDCKHVLRVVIGRKSTARKTTCESCGKSYEYSAWKLNQPRTDGDTVGLHSFYQVDMFQV